MILLRKVVVMVSMKGIMCCVKIVSFAVICCLSSCTDDKNNLTAEFEEAATRTEMEGEDGMKVFKNNYVCLAYPESMGMRLDSEEDNPFMEEVFIYGGGMYISIESVAFAIDEDAYVTQTYKDSSYRPLISRENTILDGRVVTTCYSESEEFIRTEYVYQNGKATLVVTVGRKKGVQTDYDLAAHFRWVMQEKVNVNWMSEMEKFIATVNQGYQDEGRRNSYMKIDSGQGLFIIHKEKHGTVESWEEALEELSGIIGSVSVFKQCAEAGYTFLFEAVDEDDNITYSYKFTPEDYNK